MNARWTPPTARAAWALLALAGATACVEGVPLVGRGGRADATAAADTTAEATADAAARTAPDSGRDAARALAWGVTPAVVADVAPGAECVDHGHCRPGALCCGGSCADVRTSAEHCGGCGAACAVAHGAPACRAGRCAVAACDAGAGDCDGDPATGCEVDLLAAVDHCGACGRACPAAAGATATCAAGACGLACAAGRADCDGDGRNGCETDTRAAPDHCGGCGRACAFAHGEGVCAAGACALGACDDGYADCDGAAANGCEVDLRESAAHCGGCRRACAFDHAAPRCLDGRCAPGACDAGSADCDGAAATGCEVDVTRDARHCGACGRACAEGAACVAGACRFGSGRDGALVVPPGATRTINTAAASASALAGARTVAVDHARGAFVAGQAVLLHQTQSPTGDAGYYELARVAAVGEGTLSLAAPLVHPYATDGAWRAQVVVVAEHTTVTVAAGATLTAPPWDGRTGGVLALDATGAVAVEGRVDMTGRGFRGRAHATGYRCGRGYQGEGHTGAGGVGLGANGSGGGGGGGGHGDGAGGGGGHGAAGGDGAARPGCGACAECVGGAVAGGAGGDEVGAEGLGAALFLGGAGGEGGADEDGCRPGAGGHGGGAALVRAASIAVTGNVTASGSAGEGGVSAGCGGCGMGGGGGGAGGAVRLVALAQALLGDGLVAAAGAGGGGGTCASNRGAAGAAGRVGVRAATIHGATTPAFARE